MFERSTVYLGGYWGNRTILNSVLLRHLCTYAVILLDISALRDLLCGHRHDIHSLKMFSHFIDLLWKKIYLQLYPVDSLGSMISLYLSVKCTLNRSCDVYYYSIIIKDSYQWGVSVSGALRRDLWSNIHLTGSMRPVFSEITESWWKKCKSYACIFTWSVIIFLSHFSQLV